MTTLALLVPVAGIVGFWAGVAAKRHHQDTLAERACLEER
jgi:hypothetical protein